MELIDGSLICLVSGGGILSEITCSVCKKKKPKSQFANRQLQKFAASISNRKLFGPFRWTSGVINACLF